MSFPATPLPIVQQLLIDGTWTDITSDTRAANQITITRGYSGEQFSLSAGNAQFTLNNRDGKYTNRNPTSPYYRQLGRNTQYRTGVDTGVVSARFLDALDLGTNAYDGSVIWTADKAGLDIVGDIDVAVDVDPIDWRGRKGHIFASKYLIAGNQRSWVFLVDPFGYLNFIWSTDGTAAARLFAICPTPVNPTGRVQYRVQLDVNNGAGGWTATFYVGDGTGINGTYTSIGTVSGTGTTSIFSSSARVEVGDANNAAGWAATFTSGTDADPFVGKFYGCQIRNSLGGTIVATMRADSRTAGDTTWTDSVPNTWTVEGSTYLESIDFRFWGEVPSLPNRWDISGSDIYIPIRAADIVQRLTSGNNSKPLKSPVFRNLSQFAWDGYWPMEQAAGASLVSAYVGHSNGKVSADFTGQPTTFPGSAGALTFSADNGFASGIANSSSGTPATTTFLVYFKFNTAPPSATLCPIIQFYPLGGTAGRITFYANNAGYQMIIIAPDGTALATSNPGGYGGAGYAPTIWTAMRVKLSSSGGTINYEWAWYQVNGLSPIGLSGSYSGTMGRPYAWRTESFTGKSGLNLAHAAMGSFDFDFTSAAFIDSTNAFDGEQWDVRARRLAGEQGQQVFLEGAQDLHGASAFVHTMGPQSLSPFVALLQECADVAGGILYAPRDKLGLTIRSWEQMANQSGPQLDYAQNHLSGALEPEPDDFLLENDVTLTSPDGSSFRYVKMTGSLNVNDPATDPDGVGTYDVAGTINLSDPTDLPQFTMRRVSFGTIDEARFPQVQVQMERAPFLASATLTAFCRRMDLGRAFSIINPPAWLPPGSIDLMVSGYVEILGGQTNTLTWNTRPQKAWRSGIWASTARPSTSLWGAKATTLKTTVTSTATSLTFTTADGREKWSTTAEPYDVEIAGERITVTSMAARTGTGPYDQIATVTRSVNGVVKALAATEPVTLVNAGRWS
jgi:hypothetical protein